MKKVFHLIKRVVFSILFLYCLNLITISANFIIPINVFSVGLLTFLGIPGLASLIIINFIL